MTKQPLATASFEPDILISVAEFKDAVNPPPNGQLDDLTIMFATFPVSVARDNCHYVVCGYGQGNNSNLLAYNEVCAKLHNLAKYQMKTLAKCRIG
jgi:hypothetical protein